MMEGYSVAQLDELREAIQRGELGLWRIGRIQWCQVPNRPGGYWVWLTFGLGLISLELPSYQPLNKLRRMTRFGEAWLAQRERERAEQAQAH